MQIKMRACVCVCPHTLSVQSAEGLNPGLGLQMPSFTKRNLGFLGEMAVSRTEKVQDEHRISTCTRKKASKRWRNVSGAHRSRPEGLPGHTWDSQHQHRVKDYDFLNKMSPH